MKTISACMIIKNEEHNLSRCLTSIKPLVDEIIIVDTGSTDKSIEIAESFGAKIYHHPWENDFSKHRNQSLSYATSDWVLIVDADEEFFFGPDGAKTIKENVLSFTEKENDSAAVLLKDIQNSRILMQFSTVRFFKRGKVHYEGIVHNHAIVKGNAIVIPETIVYMHHYGYDLTPGKKQQKFDRSVNLLKKRLKKDASDYVCYFYLFEFYAVHKRYQEAAKYGEKYLKHKPLLKGKRYFNTAIYYGMARNYMELKDYKHAEMMFTEGLKEIPNDLDLSFGLTEFGIRVKRPDLTTLGARQYLNLYEKYTQKVSSRASNFMYSFSPENRAYVMVSLVLAQLNEAYKTLEQVKLAFQSIGNDFKNKIMTAFLEDAKKIGLDSFVKENLDIGKTKSEIPIDVLQQSTPISEHYFFN